MTDDHDALGKGTTQQDDRDTRPESAETAVKRQSGRPPARPPYQQYLRVSKVVK
jgi:hypothetical protein